MRAEKLSGRQLWVAAVTAGLSTAAATAGRADWRWMLPAVPAAVLVFRGVLKRMGTRPLFGGGRGAVLRILYGGWAVVLMAEALRRAAERLQSAAEGQWPIGLLMAVLSLPLLWMGWHKAAAFFRASEIFWLAAAVTVGAILAMGAFRVEGRYLFTPGPDWSVSLLAGAEVLGVAVFILPHIYKVAPAPGDERRGLTWLAGLGALASALAAMTAGMLSPAVASALDRPFFVTVGLLGRTARLEGLISALWLLPDLTFIGLLSRTWGETKWPAGAVLAALGLALTGWMAAFPAWAAPAGCVALVILTGALSGGGKK